MTYLLALDQGTSSSRSIVFDESGHIVAQAQLELPQIYPQPGWVEHDPLEIWRTQLATARDALAKGGHCGQRHTRCRHHQPARNHGAVEPPNRAARAPRHRLAGPARRTRLRPAARTRPCRHHPGQDRPAGGRLLLRHQTAVDAGPCARRAASGRARRAGLWHGGQLADVETHPRQSARDGCEQRLAHHAVQCAHQPVGRRAAGAAAHSQGADARGAAVQRPLWRHRGRPAGPRHPHRRRGGRPAKRAVRPGLLHRRHGQEHLWHRLLHAHAHGRHVPDLARTACSPPAQRSRAPQPEFAHGRQRVRGRRGGAVAARRPARHLHQQRGGVTGPKRARFGRRDDGARLHRPGRARTGSPTPAAPSPASRAAPRWATLRARRSKALPTRAPPCCWP